AARSAGPWRPAFPRRQVPLRTDQHSMPSSLDTVRVVLFSGGRGSGVLSKQLLKDPHIQLTLAINGYDDGASTGEVRRFLGDSLGPSDFRKNASRLATELRTCSAGLIEVLDSRLPAGITPADAVRTLETIIAGRAGEWMHAFLD